MAETYTFASPRKSHLSLGQVYFWTTTIMDWKKLLAPDKYKMMVIDALSQLVSKQFIQVYGFVIMPNHIHLLWEMLSKNGKEMPSASFNKQLGHLIIRDLKQNHPKVLRFFQQESGDRQYRVWQRDALAVLMDSREKAEQKLNIYT